MTNSTPRFPFPTHLLPATTAIIPEGASLPLVEACSAEDLALAIRSLYNVNQLMANEGATRKIWSDGVFSWMHIVPVLHNLLLTKFDDPNLSILRAGAMLYIAAIRRRMGVKFLTHTQIRSLKNSMMALSQESEPTLEPAIWIWLLVLGSTLSFLHDDHIWFVSQTAQCFVIMRYESMDQMLGYVKSVLWIESILVPELETLRQELTAAVKDMYGTDLS